MSLYHVWQQSRQQRQQTVAQLLLTVNQQRQITATQLRDDLSLFREMLAHQDQARRVNAQRFQIDLRQFKAGLQSETQAFLANTSHNRQIEAQKLAQELTLFAESLRVEVADLRQDLQLELTANKEAVQHLLSDNREQRRLVQLQTVQELAEFMESLRSQVQSYLVTTQAERQAMAIELRHNLTQNRVERSAEVQALFDRLSAFRGELRQTRSNLQSKVWGQAVPVATQPTKITTKPKTTKPISKVLPKPGSTKPPALTPTTTKFVTHPVKPPAPTLPSVGAFQNGASVAVVPVPTKDSLAYEKEVYNHIHTVNGARLTEIESSLEINRIQAVDALRSLIKKGLITQRDRIYLTQEPAHL